MLRDLAIDYEQRRVTLGDDPVTLTATEYELLRVLSLSAGRVFTYDTLIGHLWAEKKDFAARGRLRTFVKNLRRKLRDDAGRPAYVLTERGVGYRMARPETS